MPELPEVETCKRGIEPYILGYKIINSIIRTPSLRFPIPKYISQRIQGLSIQHLERRGKYLLLNTAKGTLLIHLGMSGSLRIVPEFEPCKKHDHIDIVFSNQKILRYHDPRRFGIFLWIESDIDQHPLLNKLGPEPLTKAFNAKYLSHALHNRKVPIKTAIMDSHIVVGVGNIYANEALYYARISPTKLAYLLSPKDCDALVNKIKKVLAKAIKVGGTTLRDFVGSDGKPGYFKQQLQVYGRAGSPCYRCQTTLVEIRINQRSTVFCPICQA